MLHKEWKMSALIISMIIIILSVNIFWNCIIAWHYSNKCDCVELIHIDTEVSGQMYQNNRIFCQRFSALLYFLILFAIATPFQMKSLMMGKDSVSCHGVTALVYSPASIFRSWGARSNMLTPFYPFSWKWEESALQFYDLIPLGEISVAPGMSNAQGMENRKYARCALPLSVSMSVYECYSYKHLHRKIFVGALKYMCVGVCKPWVLALCLKKKRKKKAKAKLVCCCTCHLKASQLLFGSSWYLFPSWTEWSTMHRVSQQIRGEVRLQVEFLLCWESEPNHGSMMSDLKRRADSQRHIPPTAVGCRMSDHQAEAFLLLMYHHDSSGIKSRNIPGKVTPKGTTFLHMIGVVTLPQNSLASGITLTLIFIHLHFEDISVTLNVVKIQSVVSVYRQD